MSNSYFQFKQFIVNQDKSAFKVGTDGVLLGACASVNKVSHILDIGTGTGLIALMAAQRSNATVFAVEPDKDSYQQACENFRNSKWSNRINAFNGRIQDFNVDFRFNLILSNPPYFVNSLKNPDLRSAKTRHNDDLSFDDLISSVIRLLATDGLFEIILPFNESKIFEELATANNLFCIKRVFFKPKPELEPNRIVSSFALTKQEPVEKVITIETNQRYCFTSEYIDLTKDFYLKF